MCVRQHLSTVLGKVDDGHGGLSHASDGLPYTTLLYADGPGYKSPRPDITNVDTGKDIFY